MNQDDFKKILDKALEPIKKDQKELKKGQADLKLNIEDLETKFEVLSNIVEKRVLPPVTYIETNIKAYKDAYQVNNANGKKLEKRVKVL